MKRRTLILVVGGLVLVAGAFPVLRLSQRGPLHNGKRAADWLDELSRTDGKSSEAKQAFHEMGARAVPYLVIELTKKSELRNVYVAFKSKLPHPLFVATPSWPLAQWNWQRRRCAATALGEIGPAAAAAIPDLIEAVNKSEPFESDRSTGASVVGAQWFPEARIEAIHALWKIDPESAVVVSTVIGALHQKYFNKVGDHAIMVLADLGPKFKAEIPTVIQNLKLCDKQQPRPLPANVYPLGGLAPGYAESVPSLIAALKDANPRAREAAAYDLGTLRPKDLPVAKAAIPTLIETLQDADRIVRITAAEAILEH